MERPIEIQNNKEFIKEIQNWQSGISKEINKLKTILIKKRCIVCGKEIKELRDSINEIKESLSFKTDTRDLIKQRLIAGYQLRSKNKKLQAELKELGEASLTDVFTKLDKGERKNGK